MFIWIWQLEAQVNKYGGINGLISKLKTLGISDVCIKYHEGSSAVGGGIDYRTAFLQYKGNFKSAGFRVGAWGYNYFNAIALEAGLINESLDNADYYMFDPEVDVSGKTVQAKEVCEIIRTAHPNSIIGYSSFPIVSLHEDIPYSVFNQYCDFASPQCYWGEMEWPIGNCITQTLQTYKANGLNKPVYPSIQSYGCDSASYNAFKAYNFSYSGIYSLDAMDLAGAIYTSGNQQASVVPTPNNDTGSDTVKIIQQQLNMLIKVNLTIDGIPGPLTIQAIKTLQSMLGLTVDGVWGINTIEAITQILDRPLDSIPALHLEYATRYIQDRVGGTINGVYNAITANNVTKWQATHGTPAQRLLADGEVGPETWGRLLDESL
jgi:hypothetical protein